VNTLSFVVSLNMFRAALVATRPHVASDKKNLQQRCVVVSLTDTAEILCTASDGLTSAIARVPFDKERNPYFELGQFSMTPETCAAVLSMFKLGKDESDAELDVSVQFKSEREPGTSRDVPVATMTFRRLGQLFGGDELKLTEPVQQRDLTGLWATISTSAARAEAKLPPVKVDSGRLAAFTQAQKAYEQPLIFSAVGPESSGLCVYCGEYFAGWVAVDRVDIDKASELRHVRRRGIWARALPAGLKAM